MPVIDKNMDVLKTASNYKFSATKIDSLGATEYTLVTLVNDASGSVYTYAKDMEKCMKTVLGACKKSPRAENLMLRVVTFNHDLNEVHGFKLLNTIKDTDYDNSLQPNGDTALFDAVQSSVETTKLYAEKLHDQDFSVNAIIFIITDGEDNSSRASASSVKKAVTDAMKDECLEQITVVLIGVRAVDVGVIDYLQNFQKDANLNQFVDIGEASPSKLAKLANFISRSVSSTSQALQNGTSSSLLTF